MAEGFRQEVINVALARLLHEQGLVTAPEYIFDATLEHGRKMVDVLVYYNGLRTAIEGEVADQPDADGRALQSARGRVEQGIAHIGIAVVYPASLRSAPFERLGADLAECSLRIALVTEAEETGFTSGNVGYLRSALQGAFERLIKEDAVAKAVALLNEGVARFAYVCMDMPGILGRTIRNLGIRSLDGVADAADELLPGMPRPRPDKAAQQMAAARIAGLVLANAMIFQEVLSTQDKRVTALGDMRLDPLAHLPLIEHWAEILKINYYPIFHVARRVLMASTANWQVQDALRKMSKKAQAIVTMRAPMRHDLMGRVYHRLLADAKYLGTYYTSIPAATILLELALRPERWNVAWHDLEAVSRFRIVDLACGTGTLLMAAAQAVADDYIEGSQGRGPGLDLAALHRVLVEDVLYGYDVVPSAVHLTASTLALRAPEITFGRMNLFSLPLGGEKARLGSIEFLHSKKVNMIQDLFGAPSGTERLDTHKEAEPAAAPVPDMDLCVMNPPFTRSVGGNLLFGSSPPAERKEMQRKLGAMLRATPRAQASSTAGLGSVFVAVADTHIKPGGRLAVVLPKAVLSGVAWSATRRLLRNDYRLEYIIASHDPERWNFSENTSLSEVLLIAVKRNAKGKADDETAQVTAVNLWRNPTTPFEALAIARALRHDPAPDIESGQGALDLMLGEQKLGEAVSVPWEYLQEQEGWLLPCAFAQADLDRVALQLSQGRLWLPGRKRPVRIPLCPLGALGDLGPDARDIHDGFALAKVWTSYAAFWGHSSTEVETMAQTVNAFLSPLPNAKPGRPLRKAVDLMPHAGRILLAERLRLNTQRLMCVRLDQPGLSNVWWPLKLRGRMDSANRQKALVLWANSTLGAMMYVASRVETEGAWCKFKKPILASMPVLDLSSLSVSALRRLAKAYDAVACKPLARLSEVASDPVRAEIDSAVGDALKLPDFSVLRTLLAQEPVVCLKRL